MTGQRGATRSETARIAILEATAAQFTERGWDHLTIEGIAAAAGVGKQTIYRWWRSKSALVAECLLEGLLLPASFLPVDTGDVRADLTAWLDAILRFAEDPRTAELFRSLVAAAAEDEQVGHQLSDALGTPSSLQTRLESARAAGDLRPDAPLRELGDALVGAVIVRVIGRTTHHDEAAGLLVSAILGPRPDRPAGAEA
jgi:AcrR family transcriptional regulator